MASLPEFETVIGLEIHCQLATETKIFCACATRPDVINANACPICAGHPGTLPVLNRKVVEYAVRAGLATGCTIRRDSVFARKNYFYPDLPKGYQISQYDRPICENGFLNIETPSGGPKRITVQRIHLEEDAGKNLHLPGYSLVDLNRAGVPLVEIVSAPELRSSEEAGAYMRAMYGVVTALGICDGNLQEGNFRCDANVSVMPKGSSVLGTRAEIKNVNSFRFVEKAIEFEVQRQTGVIRSGGKVVQETRLYDADKNATFSMRSKEEAHDYRYFPDPDLIPVKLDAAWVEKIRAALPELPEQKRARFVSQWGLTPTDAGVLGASRELTELFEAAVAEAGAQLAKSVANLIIGEVARLSNEEDVSVGKSRLKARHIADIARMLAGQEVSSTVAKQLVAAAWKSGGDIPALLDQLGLRQVNDTEALGAAVDKVVAAFPGQVAEYRAGKDKLIGFFVGQVMKETGGKANPAILQQMVKEKLSHRS